MRFIHNSLSAVSLVLLVTTLASAQHGHGHAGGGSFDPFKTPNQALAAYYQKNAAEIKQLTETAANQQAQATARAKALSQLRAKYPDHAVLTASKLIADDATEVAALASEIIAAAGVMMDHKMPAGGSQSPVFAYALAQHDVIFTALRKAVADKRQQVNGPAAKLLAAQSDPAGLEIIAEGVGSGAFSALDAVNYLGIAESAQAGQYLAKYLDNDDPKVQAAAATYLSSSPQYAPVVKDKILLNPEAKTEVRQAAAKYLARNADVALPLLNDPTTPPALYSTALDSYIKASGKKLSAAQLQSLLRGIEKLEAPPESIKDVKSHIQQLYQSKSK